MTQVNVLNLDLKGLQSLLKQWGESERWVLPLLRLIHQSGCTNFQTITGFSASLVTKLALYAVVMPPVLVSEQISQDGTHKWLLRLSDQHHIETVFIPSRGRGTLCISSQVGCTLNCSFCATGKQGFNRNLILSEVIGQVWFAKQHLKSSYRIRNVVFMGMGEPLLNYDVTVATLDLLIHDHAYGLSKYRVTVSTAGVIPAMQRLAQESEAALAVSLHASFDKLRTQLVPLNKKYHLKSVIEVCRYYYPSHSKRSVTFEYVMLQSVNDREIDVYRLIDLLSGISCCINLIPFNPVCGVSYQSSDMATIKRFQHNLIDAGFDTRIRYTRGDDIHAACGQLKGAFTDRTGRYARFLKQLAF